jgi:hypothetical protein
MASYGLMVASALLLVSSCLGQNRGGGDPRVAVPLIRDVLSRAQVSGSLEYWGRCGRPMWRPDFPTIRSLDNYSGSPRGVLQKVFVDDPKMRVTQEPGGAIRMIETDVPSDLLDVKISHVAFRGPANPGPNGALLLILLTPEVKAFLRAQDIELLNNNLAAPGNSGSGGRHAYGELDNVTVSQALDYVLQIFPGFWVYESCPSEYRGRTVLFDFFENDIFLRPSQ